MLTPTPHPTPTPGVSRATHKKRKLTTCGRPRSSAGRTGLCHSPAACRHCTSCSTQRDLSSRRGGGRRAWWVFRSRRACTKKERRAQELMNVVPLVWPPPLHSPVFAPRARRHPSCAARPRTPVRPPRTPRTPHLHARPAAPPGRRVAVARAGTLCDGRGGTVGKKRRGRAGPHPPARPRSLAGLSRPPRSLHRCGRKGQAVPSWKGGRLAAE